MNTVSSAPKLTREQELHIVHDWLQAKVQAANTRLDQAIEAKAPQGKIDNLVRDAVRFDFMIEEVLHDLDEWEETN